MSTVVFSFARMNPPTKGHEHLLETMKSVAKEVNATVTITYLSQTHDTTSNPLNWEHKLQIAQKCFHGSYFSRAKDIKTPFQALEKICEITKHSDIVLVVGDDRIEQFEKMSKYAKEWGAKSFKIVSAGHRDNSSGGVAGVSSTKAREYAVKGNYTRFARMLPESLNLRYKQEIYNTIRERLSED